MPQEDTLSICVRLEKELHEVRKEIKDLDRQVLLFHSEIKVNSDEIASLRASRHEHGQWLNRHNLEMAEMRTKMVEIQASLDSLEKKSDKIGSEFNTYQLTILSQMAAMKSDLRQNTWVVGLIVGLIVFAGKTLANKIGF